VSISPDSVSDTDRLSVNSHAAAWAFDDHRLTPTGPRGGDLVSPEVRLDEITDRQGPGSVLRLAIVAGLEDFEGRRARRADTGGL